MKLKTTFSFETFSQNHSNARAPQTVRKRRFQSRKSVHFPNIIIRSMSASPSIHVNRVSQCFFVLFLFSYSRLNPRIKSKNLHINTINLHFEMRPIWILNMTTLYIEQVAEATKMADKWLPHLSFILLMVNSGRENNEHQLNFKCSMVKTLAFVSASFIVHVWKTNWFFSITSSHLPPTTKRKC